MSRARPSGFAAASLVSESNAVNRAVGIQGGAPRQRTASAFNAFFAIFKTCCGLGLLTVPFGFRTGGIGLGMFCTFLVSVMSNWGARLIISVKVDIENTTAVSCVSLQEVCRVTLGPFPAYFFKFCLLASQLGCVSGYHAYISRSIDAFNGGDLKNVGPRYTSIAAGLIPLFFLLVCFKSVKHVSYLAASATIIIVSTCFCLILYGLFFVCSGVTACGDVE
jgi:amino acid permease